MVTVGESERAGHHEKPTFCCTIPLPANFPASTRYSAHAVAIGIQLSRLASVYGVAAAPGDQRTLDALTGAVGEFGVLSDAQKHIAVATAAVLLRALAADDGFRRNGLLAAKCGQGKTWTGRKKKTKGRVRASEGGGGANLPVFEFCSHPLLHTHKKKKITPPD